MTKDEIIKELEKIKDEEVVSTCDIAYDAINLAIDTLTDSGD